MIFLSSDFFQNYLFQKIRSGTLSVSNSLDPDQGCCSVGSYLGPNCYQKLSEDTKIQRVKKVGVFKIFDLCYSHAFCGCSKFILGA